MIEGASAAGVSARALENGEEAASAGDATEATGDPVDLVLHVANVVGAAGETLRAGEVVSAARSCRRWAWRRATPSRCSSTRSGR